MTEPLTPEFKRGITFCLGVLHGVRSARAVSFASDEQRQAISIEETKGREGIV